MITNISKQALEKKHEIMQTAFTKHLGDEFEQRSSLIKIQVQCSKTGMPIFDWIQGYCDEHPQKGDNTHFVLPSSERNEFLAEMKVLVEKFCKSNSIISRSFHYQHRASNRILKMSYHAKVPVLQWLMAYHTHQSTQPQPLERTYNCPNPNCNFTTQNYHTWVGHGPSRCLRKSERLNSLSK